jgi:hypothetical protein
MNREGSIPPAGLLEFGFWILNYDAQTQINYSNSIRFIGSLRLESDNHYPRVNLFRRAKIVNDSRDSNFCVRRQCPYIERVRQLS